MACYNDTIRSWKISCKDAEWKASSAPVSLWEDHMEMEHRTTAYCMVGWGLDHVSQLFVGVVMNVVVL
jgi:hypothetical protein